MVCSLLRRKYFTTDYFLMNNYFQPLIFPKLWYIMMLFLVRHTGPWVLYEELSVVSFQYQLKSNYIHHSLDLKYYTAPLYGGLT